MNRSNRIVAGLALAIATGVAWPTAVHAELMRRVSYEYDALGRVIRERHVNPSDGSDFVAFTYGYDAEGRVTTVTDAIGRTTTIGYDTLGRVASSRDAGGGTAYFAYNAGDQVTRVTDPRGLVTEYELDGFGQVWKLVSPDSGTTALTYGATGLLGTVTQNDGSAKTYAYDAAERISAVTAGNVERRFVYGGCANGVGRLCKADVYAEGILRHRVEHAYDPRGAVTLRVDSGVDDAGVDYQSTVTYAHDAMGRLANVGYPGGVGVEYIYVAGRLDRMVATIDGATRTVAANISHQPFGPPDGWTYGNGLERLYDFDSNGRLFGISTGTGSALVQSLTYALNGADEITAITNGLRADESRKFQYDGLGRLTKETQHGNEWAFDANGNRLRWKDGGGETLYQVQAGGNRLLGSTGPDGARSYVHDGRGNRVSESAPGHRAAYEYDGFNRLRVATVNGEASTYTVNAMDQRVAKSTPSGSTRFVYAEQNRLMAEQGEGGWTAYLWLGDELVGLVKPDRQLRFVHNDHLGRPEAVTEGGRQIVWRARNEEYGRDVAADEIGGLNLGFPGQYHDSETGLFQNGFRDGYDASTGDYTQPDPIGLAGGGYSIYAYAQANPLNIIDPVGLRGLLVRPNTPTAGARNPNQLRLPLSYAPGAQPAAPQIVLHRTHQRWEYHTATVKTYWWRDKNWFDPWPAGEYDETTKSEPCSVMVCGAGVQSHDMQACPDPTTAIKQQMSGLDGAPIGCRCL